MKLNEKVVIKQQLVRVLRPLMQGKSRKIFNKNYINPEETLDKPCINLAFDPISDSGNL
tara:strand:+ start:1199 stop:1375 length:177 start_codon:yes stop_codon:yes gene_type:complete